MQILENLLEIIYSAGRIILNRYGSSTSTQKKDGSPVTLADQESHDYLCKQLAKCLPYPVLSEESVTAYSDRKNWKNFWLIDPLDGTKEFLAQNDDFCINIALIQDGRPIFAVIYAPAKKEIYYAQKDQGAYLIYDAKNIALPMEQEKGLLVSRFHQDHQILEFQKKNKIAQTKVVGAGLKFAYIARGKANIYLRYCPCREWDVAAGELLVAESGGSIYRIQQKASTFQYNTETLVVPPFIAYRNCDLKDLFIPKT